MMSHACSDSTCKGPSAAYISQVVPSNLARTNQQIWWVSSCVLVVVRGAFKVPSPIHAKSHRLNVCMGVDQYATQSMYHCTLM